jgi:exosortase
MGTTSTILSPNPSSTTKSSVKQIPWVGIAWIAALLCLPYIHILSDMVREWFSMDDMGHGIFVPIICGYLVWMRQDEILNPANPPQPSWWGLLLVIAGFFQAILGTLGADFFIARTAFVVALIGVIVTFGGFGLVRKLAFPLFLLLFMIRIPLFIYSQITFPLQIFASQLAAGALSVVGIPVMREGNVLELASQKLSVVEACSGIRSLISLSFVALVYGYFMERKTPIRIVLLAASIPVAIICNAGRITITGILSQYKPEFAEGVYHSLEGWVMFMVALLVLISVHRSLNCLYGLFHARKTAVSS